jgi:hypothetical protein
MEAASGNTVLIIEDERDVVDLLAPNFRKAGSRPRLPPIAGLDRAISQVKIKPVKHEIEKPFEFRLSPTRSYAVDHINFLPR